MHADPQTGEFLERKERLRGRIDGSRLQHSDFCLPVRIRKKDYSLSVRGNRNARDGEVDFVGIWSLNNGRPGFKNQPYTQIIYTVLGLQFIPYLLDQVHVESLISTRSVVTEKPFIVICVNSYYQFFSRLYPIYGIVVQFYFHFFALYVCRIRSNGFYLYAQPTLSHYPFERQPSSCYGAFASLFISDGELILHTSILFASVCPLKHIVVGKSLSNLGCNLRFGQDRFAKSRS